MGFNVAFKMFLFMCVIAANSCRTADVILREMFTSHAVDDLLIPSTTECVKPICGDFPVIAVILLQYYTH